MYLRLLGLIAVALLIVPSPARSAEPVKIRVAWIAPVTNLDALQRNVDLARELGFVRQSLDVRKHADLSLIEEAAARLR